MIDRQRIEVNWTEKKTRQIFYVLSLKETKPKVGLKNNVFDASPTPQELSTHLY